MERPCWDWFLWELQRAYRDEAPTFATAVRSTTTANAGRYKNSPTVAYVYSAPTADGDWQAADNLLATAEAYARLLAGLMDSSWLTDDLIGDQPEFAYYYRRVVERAYGVTLTSMAE